jgi:hypothetical protein
MVSAAWDGTELSTVNSLRDEMTPQTTTVEFPPRIGARDHQPNNQNQQRLWVPPKVNDIWLNVDDTRSVDLKRGAECPGVYILA